MTDELDSLADSRHKFVSPATELMSAIRFYVWAIWGIGTFVVCATIAATLWYSRVEGKISEYDKQTSDYSKLKEKRDTQIQGLEHYEISNDLVNTAQQNLIQRLIERVGRNEGRLDSIEPHVTEMWFMKEHGISNKEDFQLKHGYPAPLGAGEGIEPTPIPQHK